jgi:hypothetical protein
MKKFYVWLLPEKREVYISDRFDIPVYACNLSKLQKILIKDLGGNRQFDSWEKATEYGERVAAQMNWHVEYENEAGRQVEYAIQHGMANRFKGTKVIGVCCIGLGGAGEGLVRLSLQSKHPDIIVVSAEDLKVKEQTLITAPSPMIITPRTGPELYVKPISRSERRKQNRKNKK